MNLKLSATNWKKRPLGDIATIERDAIAPESIQSGTKYVGLENITGEGQFTGVSEVRNGELASTKFQFTDKHILYGKLRPYLAKIGRPDFSGVCSTDILPVLPGDQVDRGYLCYFLRLPEMVNLAASQSIGANLPRLSPTRLAEFEILLPPLSEQKRIADILDKADAIRRKRRDSNDLFNELLKASYLDFFGDPRGTSKATRIEPLGAVCSVQRGKFTPRPRNDPRFYGGLYPFIQTGDISSSGGMLSKWNQTLNEQGVAVSRSFHPGTVVIAIVGATIGETAILSREMYCPDSVVGITPKADKATSEYIEYTLRFFKQHFRDMAPETARANINLETLRPLGIPVPALRLQQQFTSVYRKCYGMKQRIADPRDESDELFDSLVQRAFRGELSTRKGVGP